MDTVGWWFLVRFAHVSGAALWVGGQLALSLVILPLARHLLAPEAKDRFTAAAGSRFGMSTGAVFLPVQLATGWAMAGHKGVTWASLAEPGYGRTLATELALFVLVMLAAAGHGITHAKGRPGVARALAVVSLVGSVSVDQVRRSGRRRLRPRMTPSRPSSAISRSTVQRATSTSLRRSARVIRRAP